MDSNSTEKPSTKTTAPNTIPIRISKNTARLLKSIVGKCNRKNLGRRVRTDDVIKKLIGIINEGLITEIKESTYSSQDHLEIEFKKYCQKNGAISKDQFLKILISKALPKDDD
ncbi:MAG: hypothetical protein AB8G05_09945 [Oligoflexales bacterium]